MVCLTVLFSLQKITGVSVESRIYQSAFVFRKEEMIADHY